MRRTPAAMDCSATILKTPISPVRSDVRAAAKLLAVEAARRGVVGNGDDADVGFRILVAEEGERAGGESVVDVHDVRADFEILADFFVHLLLDIGDFARIDGGEVRKIEAQVIGRDERAGLLHVRAEDVAQRGVHQVRGRVVAHVAGAAVGVGDGGDAVADAQIFFRDDAVRDQSGDRIIRAADFGDFERFGIVVERRQCRRLGRRIRNRSTCGQGRFRLPHLS